jgi:hypothetical protein
MLATTNVWASKTRSLNEVMVARLTATDPPKKARTASSDGDTPGGATANASCARLFTLLAKMASISSWLKPAFLARDVKASVEYTNEVASCGASAMVLWKAVKKE